MRTYLYLFFERNKKVIGHFMETSEVARDGHAQRAIHPQVRAGGNPMFGDYCVTFSWQEIQNKMENGFEKVPVDDVESLLRENTPSTPFKEATIRLCYALISIGLFAADHGETTEFMS